MREYLATVVGNAALRQRLGQELEENAFSHAYILEGPAGIGKQTLALALSLSLACENKNSKEHPLPCMKCPTCRKILSGNSPDVIHIRREEDKTTMGVDVVRRLRNDVAVVPNDLHLKIYLIHDAHTMTVQAQNALLLTLEEPPAFVLFLLLSEDADALLETIRSRAPILRMQPVSDTEMADYLLHNAEENVCRAAAALRQSAPDDFAAVLRMAGGRIGAAIPLLDPEKREPLLKNRADVMEICRHLADRTHTNELLSALLAFGKNRESVAGKLQLLESALRDLLLLGYNETARLLFFTDRESAIEQSAHFTASRLLSAVSAVEQTVAALSANGNVRLLLVQLLLKLTDV